MGCGTDDLYAETGGKKTQRDTLPPVAQNALTAAEAQAATDLTDSPPFSGAQTKIHQKIVDTSRQAGRKTRRWLPW